MYFTVFSALPVLIFNSSCDFISPSVLVQQYVKKKKHKQTNKKQQTCNGCFPITCSHVNMTGIILSPLLSMRLIEYASQHISIAIYREMKIKLYIDSFLGSSSSCY